VRVKNLALISFKNEVSLRSKWGDSYYLLHHVKQSSLVAKKRRKENKKTEDRRNSFFGYNKKGGRRGRGGTAEVLGPVRRSKRKAGSSFWGGCKYRKKRVGYSKTGLSSVDGAIRGVQTGTWKGRGGRKKMVTLKFISEKGWVIHFRGPVETNIRIFLTVQGKEEGAKGEVYFLTPTKT